MSAIPRMIAFEGPDGAGKSTLLTRTAVRMDELDVDYIHVRNPGGTPAGEAIRELLLNPKIDLDPMAQMYLFIASRVQLVEERIKPALARGQVVLCDRLDLSTIFYQTAAYKWQLTRKYGNTPEVTKLVSLFHDRVKELNRCVTDDIDLRYVLVDASNATLNQRRPPNMEDRFEMKGESFQKDVRAFYRHYAQTNTNNHFNIKTDDPTSDKVLNDLITWITEPNVNVCPTKITA